MIKIITIHASNAIDFLKNNGIGVLTDFKSSPTIKEAINGEFYIEFEYINSGRYSKYLCKENIIVSPVGYGDRQAFRITKARNVIDDSGEYIYIYAKHITYDLTDNFLDDVYVQDLSGDRAINWILSHTQYEHKFTGYSDIPLSNNARYVSKNPIQALISDEDNSFVNRWGGEIVRDNFTIKMLQARGEDKGVTIRYRKNLTGIKFETDYSSIATRVKPTGYDGMELPEKFVDSLLINNYIHPKITEKKYEDIKLKEDSEDEDGFDTLEECYSELRKRVNQEYENGLDKPTISATVDFIELSKTEEYKDYKKLEKLCIGDTVHIYIDEFNIEVAEKVISTTYDPILERYTSFELGKPFTSYTLESKNYEKELKETVIPNYLDVARQHATDLLTNALGGFVVKTRNELFILDNEDMNKAEKVWRWNINGLGYSKTGINGPYETAITADGQIVANFITTGTMSVDRIEGLSSTLTEFSKIILEMNRAAIIVSNTVDITKEIDEDETSMITLENCMAGPLQSLRIYGNNTVFENDSNIIVHSEDLKSKFERKYGYRSLGYSAGYNSDYVVDSYTAYAKKGTSNNRFYIMPLQNGKTYNILLDKDEVSDSKWLYMATFSEDPLENEDDEYIYAIKYYGVKRAKYDKDNDSWIHYTNTEENIITITPEENEKYLIFYSYTVSTFESAKIYENYREINLGIEGPLNSYKKIDEDGNEIIIRNYISYENNILKLIKKIGRDEKGNLYLLDSEEIIYLNYDLPINLNGGTNYIKLCNYSAPMYAKYVQANDFTKLFATQVEMNAAIEILSNKILLAVTQGNIISAINLAIKNDEGIIDIITNHLKIQSDNFNLTPEGFATILAGLIGGLTINNNSLYKTYTLNGTEYESGLNIPESIVDSNFQAFLYAGKKISKGYYTSNMYMTHTGKMFIRDGYLIMTYQPMETETSVTLNFALVFTASGINRYLENGNRWTYEGIGYQNNAAYSHALFLYDAIRYEIINGTNSRYLFYMERDSAKAWFAGDLYVNSGYPVIHSVTTDAQWVTQMRHSVSYLEYVVNGYGSFGINVWSSDKRLKKDIEDTEVNGLEVINAIRHVKFKWKENDEEVKNNYIAQDLEKIDKNLVKKSKQSEESKYYKEYGIEELYQINESNLIPYITKSIQELSSENKKLKCIIGDLEARIQKLENLL